eukprot:2844425-Alexandrium_andersonii.AAC.1
MPRLTGWRRMAAQAGNARTSSSSAGPPGAAATVTGLAEAVAMARPRCSLSGPGPHSPAGRAEPRGVDRGRATMPAPTYSAGRRPSRGLSPNNVRGVVRGCAVPW